MGFPAMGSPWASATADPGRLSERHLAQTVEQGLGILLVTGLARVVGAQGHAAHASELLGRDLGILLAVELLPEILVEPAAIHLGLRRRRSGHHAERHEADECRPEHLFLRWLVLGFALGTQQSLGCCGPAKVTRRFRINCQGEHPRARAFGLSFCQNAAKSPIRSGRAMKAPAPLRVPMAEPAWRPQAPASAPVRRR